jgi:tetratricopeptide (TPR) repeat protein
MKKIYLLTVFLLSINLAHSNQPNKRWVKTQTGRYYHTRFDSFNEGVDNLENSSFKQASSLFRKSLTCTYRFNFPAYNNYAVAVAQTQNYQQAIGLLQKSLESGNDPWIVQYNLFICHLNNKKYHEAGNTFMDLPENIRREHAVESGNFLMMTGQPEIAYTYFMIALEDSTKKQTPETYFNAALSAWVVSDTTFSIILIDRAISAQPQQAVFHIQKAKMFLSIDPNVSVRSFRRALRIDGKNLECRMGLINSLLSTGKAKEALQILEPMIKDKPINLPDIYQAIAIAWSQLADAEKALENMNKVCVLRTPTAVDHRIFGDIYLNADSISLAKIHYQLSLADSMISDTRLGLSIIAFLEDDMNEALFLIDQIKTLSPQYKFTSYGYYLESMIHYAQGNYPAFEATITKAGYGKSKEASKLLVLAMRSFSQFEFRQAEKYLDRALRIEPENLNLHLAKGSLHYQLSEYEKAISVFKNTLTIDPGNLEIKNMLALSLAGSGDTDAAIQLMTEVLSKKPKSRYFNNMAMIYAMIKVPSDKDQADYCGYFETALLYLDSAFIAGIHPVFELNRANITLSLQDTAEAKKLMIAMNHAYALNNLAVLNFLDQSFSSAAELILSSKNASGEHVPGMIEYNARIISKQTFTDNEVKYIYLYQFLPSILPSRHQISYTFSMENEKPIQSNGNYIVYIDLDGTNSDSAITLATK